MGYVSSIKKKPNIILQIKKGLHEKPWGVSVLIRNLF